VAKAKSWQNESRFTFTCVRCGVTSEVELQSELDLAGSSRSSNPTKVWVAWFAKVLITGDIIEAQVSIDPSEVRMVEGIEHLCAELKTIVITHFPVLYYGEIKVLA